MDNICKGCGYSFEKHLEVRGGCVQAIAQEIDRLKKELSDMTKTADRESRENSQRFLEIERLKKRLNLNRDENHGGQMEVERLKKKLKQTEAERGTHWHRANVFKKERDEARVMIEQLRKGLSLCDEKYADARYEIDEMTRITYRGKELETFYNSIQEGFHLRVLGQGGLCTSSFNEAKDFPQALNQLLLGVSPAHAFTSSMT